MKETKPDIVSALFVRNDGHGQQVLLQKKDRGYKNGPDNWQLIGGHIEDGENVQDTLRREVLEELSYTLSSDNLPGPKLITNDKKKHIAVYVMECPFTLSEVKIGEGCGIAFWYVDELENIKTAPHELEFFQKLIVERGW